MDANWVYLKTESNLYTVGFYDPDGEWIPESDHETSEAAAARIHYLNGGSESSDSNKLREALAAAVKWLGKDMQDDVKNPARLASTEAWDPAYVSDINNIHLALKGGR